MKRIINISLVILAVAGIITLVSAISVKSGNAGFEKACVEIYRNNVNGFLDKEELLNNLNISDTVITKLIQNDINTEALEDSIMKNPFVKDADVFLSIDNKLIINIREREPVIRIFTDDDSFYLDKDGDIFPVSDNYSPRVTVANGYVGKWTDIYKTNIFDSVYDNSKLKDLYILNSMINDYPLLGSQIEQLYINSKNDYDLVPELGNHIIQLGNLSDIETKLRNLNAFYLKILLTEKWDSYKSINMTYKNQIVCTKK